MAMTATTLAASLHSEIAAAWKMAEAHPSDPRTAGVSVDGCRGAVRQSPVKTFAQCRPRPMSASLTFDLHIKAGEQEHDAEVTTIELQQGPPMIIDVISILAGGKESGSAILLKSNTFVDTDRKITVEVSEYQPLELKNLRLLLLPILPDHAPRL